MTALSVHTNRKVAWWGFTLSVALGLLMGAWSFEGPLPVPAFLGLYEELPRRLLRLGHIAFFGIGLLHLQWVRQFAGCEATTALRVASRLWIFGNLALPGLLVVAACWPVAKVTLSLPAGAVLAALVLSCRALPGADAPPEEAR